MRKHLLFPIILLLVILITFLGSCTSQNPVVTPADREAIAAAVQALDAAYGAKDAARFSALFTEDADFRFPVEGLVMRGREEIRKHFAAQFASSPPLRHVTTMGEMVIVSPGLAAADIQVDILAVDSSSGATRQLLHYEGLGLGSRTGSDWRIRLVRLFPAAK